MQCGYDRISGYCWVPKSPALEAAHLGGALTDTREVEYPARKLSGHPYGPGQEWLAP